MKTRENERRVEREKETRRKRRKEKRREKKKNPVTRKFRILSLPCKHINDKILNQKYREKVYKRLRLPTLDRGMNMRVKKLNGRRDGASRSP